MNTANTCALTTQHHHPRCEHRKPTATPPPHTTLARTGTPILKGKETEQHKKQNTHIHTQSHMHIRLLFVRNTYHSLPDGNKDTRSLAILTHWYSQTVGNTTGCDVSQYAYKQNKIKYNLK